MESRKAKESKQVSAKREEYNELRKRAIEAWKLRQCKINDPSNPNKCEECGKTFAWKHLLIKHNRKVHKSSLK